MSKTTQPADNLSSKTPDCASNGMCVDITTYNTDKGWIILWMDFYCHTRPILNFSQAGPKTFPDQKSVNYLQKKFRKNKSPPNYFPPL